MTEALNLTKHSSIPFAKGLEFSNRVGEQRADRTILFVDRQQQVKDLP